MYLGKVFTEHHFKYQNFFPFLPLSFLLSSFLFGCVVMGGRGRGGLVCLVGC